MKSTHGGPPQQRSFRNVLMLGTHVKPKSYYNLQKKVFAAMLARQQVKLLADTSPKFEELPPPAGEK